LDGILTRSIESNGQVIGVVGDAGVGKSRLCLEFTRRCRDRGVVVHEVHCPSHGPTVSWLAIRQLLRSYFALADTDRAEAVRRSVERQLLALDGGFRAAVPLVLEVLGVSNATTVGDSPQSSNARLADFVRRFISLRSANEPVALLLDDAHWIDLASDELVRQI